MRRSIILLTALLAAAACRQAEDTRYFAPAVQFGSDRYAVSAGDGGLDIDLHLSRPASQALHIGLNVSSSLEEGVQYRVASRTVDIAPGQQDATVHVDLLDDEIWVESAWIDLLLKPGERYTLDPEKNCSTRVDVSKAISIPIFRLVAPDEKVETNPYLAETLRFQLEADRATSADLEVVIGFGDLELGKDYRSAGSETAGFIYPAGARSQTFEVEILKKDLSGYDREALLAVVPQKGSYSVDPDKASVPVHLSDPVVLLNQAVTYRTRSSRSYRPSSFSSVTVTWPWMAGLVEAAMSPPVFVASSFQVFPHAVRSPMYACRRRGEGMPRMPWLGVSGLSATKRRRESQGKKLR